MLKQEQVVPDEILTAMREHGVADLNQAASAVLEMDGSISVIPQGSSARDPGAAPRPIPETSMNRPL